MKQTILLIATALATLTFAEDTAKELPVRVYVLVGQSNMQGKGSIEGEKPNTLRNIVQNDPQKEFQFLVDRDGNWLEREDVWIHYDQGPGRVKYGGLKPGYGSSGGLIGPELGFGEKMGDVSEGQVLLVKTCWGGKSLGHNFLPPSAGRYPTPVKSSDPGFYYQEILRIVNGVTENIRTYFPDYQGQGIKIAGLCFHQGWNDQYGGLDATYEKNLAAFIKDIRSREHGLSVPGLPIVIATSGMIRGDSRIKRSQLAMADKTKYPQFAGNVAVVDTDKPYGPEKRQFWFDTKDSPSGQGYHWNNNARTYMNIGMSMAAEMRKLVKPKLPSRLIACGTSQGVELTWQLGTETPKGATLFRNGQRLKATPVASKTVFVDPTALPGRNDYSLILEMPDSPTQKLTASCDTSITKLAAYRGMAGVMLSWEARGKYEAFKILRDGAVVAGTIAGETRSYEDKEAPEKGIVTYTIQPTTGTAPPARLTVNRGPVDPGAALIYEPFDYPADADKPQSLLGKGGAPGTRGEYYYLSDKTLERAPATIAGGLSYGALPVGGNRAAGHRWSAGCAIALDDSLKKAGLLEDGATLWISYVFKSTSTVIEHRGGPGGFTLRSADLKEGVGFKASGRQYETAVVMDGEVKGVRITSVRPETPTLVVGKIVWGKDGENDRFVPYMPGHDLKQPEKHGRAAIPFNIDQTKISLLVLKQEGNLDEIRVGPTYESVVGGGTRGDN